MRLILLPLTLALSACTTIVPVAQTWPEPPGLHSMQPCPNLTKLPENPTLSQVAKTVVGNYSEYYQCAVKLEAWQEWYQRHQIIHKRLK